MDYRELTVKVGQANPLDFRSGDDFELHKLQGTYCKTTNIGDKKSYV